MADIGTSSQVRGPIPPPNQARQAPGRRERERALPQRRDAPRRDEQGPDDDRERHIDEYA